MERRPGPGPLLNNVLSIIRDGAWGSLELLIEYIAVCQIGLMGNISEGGKVLDAEC